MYSIMRRDHLRRRRRGRGGKRNGSAAHLIFISAARASSARSFHSRRPRASKLARELRGNVRITLHHEVRGKRRYQVFSSISDVTVVIRHEITRHYCDLTHMRVDNGAGAPWRRCDSMAE